MKDGAEHQSLSVEIVALLEKGAVTFLPLEEMRQGFSTFFLIPKRDWGLRPIQNVKGFNRFLKCLPFGMLSLSRHLLSLRRGDWFTTVDSVNVYEHKVLPFCLSLALCTFIKCMDAALAPLRRQGIRITSYLDGWLICTALEWQARCNTEVVLAHLRRLGLAVNREKSCLISAKCHSRLGGLIGAAPYAAVVRPAQDEPLGGWPAASFFGARLAGSRSMVAYDSGPSGCSHRSSMFQSHNIYRHLHKGLGCVVSEWLPTSTAKGGYALSGASQQGSQVSFVGACSQGLLEGGVPAREAQCGSQSSVQGRPHSRGMAAPPRTSCRPSGSVSLPPWRPRIALGGIPW